MSDPTTTTGLLHGLHYGVPIEGVIRTGYTVRHNDRRLPHRDDEFSITLKHKLPSGEWARHPLDESLREKYGVEIAPNGNKPAERKLRRIPVVIAFDNPSLTISEQFALFNADGRPTCVGNGKTCKRRVPGQSVVVEQDCPGPDNCEFSNDRCDAFVRLVVQIESQEGEGSFFILRTGSINAVTDCRTVLQSYSALFGGLAGMPMWLVLEGKSSSMSKGSTFWYASLRPREATHLSLAAKINERRAAEYAAGMKRDGYEAALLALRGNGAFAENAEDSEQFEDLIITRVGEQGDGEDRRELSIGLPQAQAVAAVADISRRLVQQAGVKPGTEAPSPTGSIEASGARG